MAGRLALAFALAASLASGAAAQTLAGRVLLDGRGVQGAAVQLHRVTRDTRGPVASATSGADGSFRFTLPPVDTTAGFTVFFATAMVHGVRYFGPALHPGETPGQYAITAYDTTSSAALNDSVRVSRRDVFLIPEMDGGMEVAEIVRVRNGARRTLLAESKPVVSFPLPPGAGTFEAGEGDKADSARGPEGVARVGDRVWVTQALVPGDRDFFFRYRLPAQVKRMPLAAGRPTDTLFVYVRQPGPDVKAVGLPKGEPYQAEGENFLRYTASGISPSAAMSMDWRGPAPPPVDPRWAALGAAGLVLAAGAMLAARRGRTPASG